MSWFRKKKCKECEEFLLQLEVLWKSRDKDKKQMYELEKEVVHWKEKALNFRRFHQ